MIDVDAIRAAAEACRPQMLDVLSRLLAIPSFSGQEGAAQQCAAEAFGSVADVQRVPINRAILDDPDFVDVGQDTSYADRCNVVAGFPVAAPGRGRSLILSTHTDVVAVEADWADAFTPRLSGDGRLLYGRGACDAKGSVATIWLVFRVLQALGVAPTAPLTAHIVIEEEIGSNGALSLVADGCAADGAIVLEPTNLQVHHANRGAVWFDLTIGGRAIHMGRRFEGVNAIEKMMKVVAALNDYEQRHLAESRGYRGFERYEFPVQMNVGRIDGGTGHSIVADSCHIAGGVGFLPNKSMKQVMAELHEVVRGTGDAWIREHYALTFTGLRNDSYEIAMDHPLAAGLAAAAADAGAAAEVFGWNVSCDAHVYAKRAGVPAVVFGPGDIADAHSRGEKIEIARILDAAVALVRFIAQWCGASPTAPKRKESAS
jgi:acetylornithine deacetylase